MRESHRKRAISFCFVFFVFCVITDSLTYASWASGGDRSETLAKLHSQKWIQRHEAYKQLAATPGALKDPVVKKALVDLLQLENHVIETAIRESHGQAGIDEKYGEGYSEYYSMLLGTMDAIANWNDPAQVCVLAHGSYNPDSPFATKLAAHGKYAVQCLIQMYGSDVGLIRAQAAAVLVEVLAKAKTDIAPGVIQQVRQIIIRALHDPSEAVRSDTVEALGSFGGTDMIPALRKVARADPSPPVHGFSVRKSAEKAITEIQKRGASLSSRVRPSPRAKWGEPYTPAAALARAQWDSRGSTDDNRVRELDKTYATPPMAVVSAAPTMT